MTTIFNTNCTVAIQLTQRRSLLSSQLPLAHKSEHRLEQYQGKFTARLSLLELSLDDNNNRGMFRISDQVRLKSKSSELFRKSSGDHLLRFNQWDRGKLLNEFAAFSKGTWRRN